MKYPYCEYLYRAQITQATFATQSHQLIQDGSIILAYFQTELGGGTVTYPSYITTIADISLTVGTVDIQGKFFYYFKEDAGAANLLSISWQNTASYFLGFVGVRGVDPTTPFARDPSIAGAQTTGSANSTQTIPYNAIPSASEGDIAFLLATIQSDNVDEPTLGNYLATPYGNGETPDLNGLWIAGAATNSPHEVRLSAYLVESGDTDVQAGTIDLLPPGNANGSYHTFHFSLASPRVPAITDVDTDETWTDGDTGLIITGTGLGV